MEPFRKLLAKNTKYLWTDEHQTSFELAKREIVKLVAKGVTSFRLNAWTCLVTDWSKTGIGYVMWLKNCNCPNIHPSCCQGGWSMITCGSRFCTPTETKYHPIEGELLGVTWALEKSTYYTLGSDKLLILVDYKPLIGLLTTHNLGEIENPRLLHLAERLLRWNFKIQHIAGAKNLTRYLAHLLKSMPGGVIQRGLGRVLVRTSRTHPQHLTQSQLKINNSQMIWRHKF